MADVRSFDAYVGGCPTNVSVGTRRLGLRSALLTAVGDDQVGDFVTAFLEREQVETRFIPRKAGRRTSAVILTIQPPDKFPLTFYRDNCADRALTIDDVGARTRSRQPRRLRHRHRPQSRAGARRDARPPPRPPARPACRWWSTSITARINGTTPARSRRRCERCFDRQRSQSAPRRNWRPRREPLTSPTGAATLLDSGIQALVLKRGARGSTIFRPNAPSADVAPFPIEVLNVLGAGDAFAVGFLYGYLQGWTLERAARMGNACGAIVVTRHGCANFMPTLDEVSAFVSSRGEPAI